MFAFSPVDPALSGNFVNNFPGPLVYIIHSNPDSAPLLPSRRCAHQPHLESDTSHRRGNFAARTSHRRVSNWFFVVFFPFFLPSSPPLPSLTVSSPSSSPRLVPMSTLEGARVCVCVEMETRGVGPKAKLRKIEINE